MQNKEKNNGLNSRAFNNKYEQVRLLGEGSFGKAFLVERIDDKSLAVIKTIDLGNMNDEEKQDAIQEGKILEQLDHPNIIKFREVYIENKSSKQTLHIVMDYADGGDLQQRIRGQKGKFFSETTILDWFTQICLAIKHIHDRKILHRDVKSQNIFLTKNGLVKLGDFGIAKCLSMTIDKAKTIVGTPYYLSPEIVQNKPYSFKSDIWSLGVLLYEKCALKMPFDAQSLPLLSLKIIKGSYGAVPPNYSKDLRSLIGTMLSVDINKRPSINQILSLNFIRSRIKNFLSEMEHNKEFSHTLLHNFNLLKAPKSEISDLLNSRENVREKRENIIKDNILNHPKPIIKKEINNPISANNHNRHQVKKNYHFVNQEKETVSVIIPSKEKEIDCLKKNLLMGNIPSNVNVSSNYVNKTPVKTKNSIEIEAHRVPKPERIIESKQNDKKIPEKKIEVNSSNENIKKNLLLNKRKEKEKDKKTFETNTTATNSEREANHMNIDRKRSGSRGSEEGKEKERNAQLKEFMKKYKEKIKVNTPNLDGDVIWLKGMKDVVEREKEIVVNPTKKDSVCSTNSTPHKEQNEKISIFNNRPNEYLQFKHKNLKDWEDFIESHKMLMELEKLQDEELLDLVDYQTPNNLDILKEYEEMSESDFIDDEKEYCDLKHDNAKFINVKVESSTIDEANIENTIKTDLVNELGKELFDKVYKTLSENLGPNLMNFDLDNLNKKIKYECSSFDEIIVETSLVKIPDIYCLVLKDLERNKPISCR